MNEITYVQLVRLENNELWFFKQTDKGWKPHHIVKDMIDGEIVEEKKEDIEAVVS